MTIHIVRTENDIQFSDADDPNAPSMDVTAHDDFVEFYASGRVYRDRDNYPTSDTIEMNLGLRGAVALREYLDEAIERMRSNVE